MENLCKNQIFYRYDCPCLSTIPIIAKDEKCALVFKECCIYGDPGSDFDTLHTNLPLSPCKEHSMESTLGLRQNFIC